MNAIWAGVCLAVIAINVIEGQRRCSSFQKKCKNGECLDSELFCDGAKDCQDGSDETGENCLMEKCPGFAFRCTYGGCVNSRDKCDGHIHCADGSDENALLCGYPTENRFAQEGKFKCDSGQTIASGDICDGKRDCEDGSDETTEICTSVSCPGFAFRCAYGGCISNELRCNRKRDCVDGSDEYPQFCGWNTTISELAPGGGSSLPGMVIPGRGCIIPVQNDLISALESTGEVLTSGSYIDELIGIQYRCRPKHLLEGAITNICVRGKWRDNHPTCSKYCDGMHLNGVTFQATCEYNRNTLSCNQPLKTNTIARITCRGGYRRPDYVSHNTLKCDEDGDWDFSPSRCIPICGTEHREGVAFIGGGQTTNITAVPWQAAIYLVSRNNTISQKCGGTILNAKVVISAAHCFWDVRQNRIINPTAVRVAVGKTYRGYFATEPYVAQFFNVSELHVPFSYEDSVKSYQDDIALLLLNNNIRFMPHIKPICLEKLEYNEQSIESNIVGRVAGWGITSDDLVSSEELKMIELPTVSYSDCNSKIDTQYKSLLTSDKFCVQGIDGETVCSGDSGGGFVVPRTINNVQTYFLWGIVSNGLTNKPCSGDFFTAYTNIHYHYKMIDTFEANNRPK